MPGTRPGWPGLAQVATQRDRDCRPGGRAPAVVRCGVEAFNSIQHKLQAVPYLQHATLRLGGVLHGRIATRATLPAGPLRVAAT